MESFYYNVRMASCIQFNSKVSDKRGPCILNSVPVYVSGLNESKTLFLVGALIFD